jgi:hypothetical protein
MDSTLILKALIHQKIKNKKAQEKLFSSSA